MAPEPERPIEELLREAAKKRGEQAGGPFELHPATRRVLQTEVSRKFEKRAEDEPAPGLSLLQLLPRLIWGATICAVLALMIWIVVPKSQPDSKQDSFSELAQAPAAAPPSAPATAAPEPESAPANTAVNRSETAPAAKNEKWEDLAAVDKAKAPAGQMDDTPSREIARTTETQPAAKKLQVPQSPNEFKNSDAKDAPVTVGEALHPAMSDRGAAKDTTRTVSSISVSNTELAIAQPVQEMLAPATAAAVPAPASASPPPPTAPAAKPLSFSAGNGPVNTRTVVPANSTTTAGALVNSLDTLTREKRPQSAAPATQFYRLSLDREKKENAATGGKTPTAVLTAFRIEQSGSELRIIDSDGSVYKGYVQPATSAARRRSISGFGGTTRAMRAPGQDEAPASAGTPAPDHSMQDYAFSVSGTSATLHKKVTFQGTLNTVNPLTLYKAASSAGTNLAGIGGNAAGEGAALINARVSGTVSVSGAKDFEIEAATPSP